MNGSKKIQLERQIEVIDVPVRGGKWLDVNTSFTVVYNGTEFEVEDFEIMYMSEVGIDGPVNVNFTQEEMKIVRVYVRAELEDLIHDNPDWLED